MYVWMVTCWVVGAACIAAALLGAVAAAFGEWLFDRQVERGARRLAELEAKYIEEGYEPWKAAEKACLEAWKQ